MGTYAFRLTFSFPIMPRFAQLRQTSKSIQLDPFHGAINFVVRNNWKLRYQTPRGKSNRQGCKTLTCSTKKHPNGCFFRKFAFRILLLQLFLGEKIGKQSSTQVTLAGRGQDDNDVFIRKCSFFLQFQCRRHSRT